MKAYILAITGAVILSAVVAIILPSGKTGVFIKSICKLVVLSIMISPVFSWLKKGDFSFETANVQLDDAYLRYCSDAFTLEKEQEIQHYIMKKFPRVQSLNVCVFLEEYRLKQITINNLNLGIIGQDEHINTIEEMKKALMERFGCEVTMCESETS